MTSTEKTIPLKSVKDALMCAVIKLKVKGREINGKPHARTAAFTQDPLLGIDCDDVRHGRKFPHLVNHFGPMCAGEMERVLRRTRLLHGLAEVRKTWRVGMRAMQAEIEWGMR